MAITETEITGIKYFRITRAWNSREYQRYVKIGHHYQKSYKEAQKEDEALATRQRAFKQSNKLSGNIYFDSNNRIVGMTRVFVTRRKNGSESEIFKLRYNPRNGNAIKYGQVSITLYGLDQAFELAVNKMCNWIGLDEKSEIRRTMLDAKVHYLDNQECKSTSLDEELTRIENSLKSSFNAFVSKGDVIDGRAGR